MTPQSTPPQSQSKASSLALHFLETRPDPTTSSNSLMSQLQHRISLVSFWDIQPGSRVLELGCGQGDTTVVLAEAVGPDGHVDAIDPGSPDYGSPYTLSQCQSNISASPLGPRISFFLSTRPTDYLATYTGPPYEYIVLAHCIYYFATPSVLPSLNTALTPHLPPNTTLCIAEWSPRPSSPSSFPHLLTALLRSTLEAHRPSPSSNNIRTVLSPPQIKNAIARVSPLKLIREKTEKSDEGLRDGFWEVSHALRKRGREMVRLEEAGVGEGQRTVVEAMFDSIESGVGELEGGVEGVRSMDFWVGVFGLV